MDTASLMQGSRDTTKYRDALNIKSVQLVALATLITGEGFDHFSNLSENVQQNLLSLVADLADQIEDANTSINLINGEPHI